MWINKTWSLLRNITLSLGKTDTQADTRESAMIEMDIMGDVSVRDIALPRSLVLTGRTKNEAMLLYSILFTQN